MTESFEKMIIAEATKIHFTPEKIKEIAQKIGPKMEATILKAIDNSMYGIVEDNIGEVMYEMDFTKIIKGVIAEKFNLALPTKGRR